MSLLPLPVVLLGFVFRGWAGRIIAFLFACVCLFSGIGMLKKRAVANSMAIGYFVFTLINTLLFLIVPGALARMQDAMQEMMPLGQVPQVDFSSAYFRLMMLLPAIVVIIALWFLITRRQAFLQERRTA